MKKFAKQIRVETLKELLNLGFGHYGGSMSIVETLAVLYGKHMKYDPKSHKTQKRSQIDKTMLKKKGKAIGITLFYFKIYFKANDQRSMVLS